MSNSAKARLDNGVNWLGDLCDVDQNKFTQRMGELLKSSPATYMDDDVKKTIRQLTTRYSGMYSVRCDLNKDGEWVISMKKING